jgi:dihydrofolate reductase
MVAKILYSASMSLDGFIAGPGGDMSWLTPYLGPDPALDGLAERIGALLVGRRTFSGDDPNRGTDKEGAFSGTWSGPQIVLTHHVPAQAGPDVTYSSDVRGAVELAKAAAGATEYVNVLGAEAARSCLEAGALDEVLVSVVPVMLGDGVRLFQHPGGRTVRLERISVAEGPVATSIWWRVLRD